MSNCVCKKCGTEGSSKCPYCRSVFPKDGTLQIIRSILSIKITDNGINIDLDMMTRNDDTIQEHFDKMMTQLVEIRASVDINQVACSHEWTFKPGCSSSIGCGHIEIN